MPNMTLRVPEDLHERMRRHAEIRWSEVARRAFEAELARLDVYDRLLANSGLTEEDAVAIGRDLRKEHSARVAERVEGLRRKRRKRSG